LEKISKGQGVQTKVGQVTQKKTTFFSRLNKKKYHDFNNWVKGTF